MTISLNIAKAMFLGSFIVAALVYGIFFGSISESDMVMLAYLWVPTCITGAFIWFTGQNAVIYAASMFIAVLLSLFAFFELIFPQL